MKDFLKILFPKLFKKESMFECYGYACGDQSKDELSTYLQEDKYEYDTIGVFFHGELEGIIGYDIPLFRIAPGVKIEAINTDSNEVWRAEKAKRHPNIPNGINDITVHVFGHKKPIQAIAYIWDGHLNWGHFKRGYIVLESDKDSNDYAKAQLEKQEQLL
jgi:hypothetical protein